MEPVLIAGAGPVGLATALLLARWQVPSIVLEAAAERSGQGSRAICFQRDVLDILDRVGCAEELVAEGVTWTTGRTYYREHELFSVTFPAPGAGTLPPWINISQASVERRLLARARHEPLIDLRFGHQVTGLAQGGSGVDAEAVADRGPVRLRGSHLVGADGSRSTVRQLLGTGFPGRSFSDQFLICDIRADLPFPAERRFFFDPAWNPGRQVLVHPCPDKVWRIDWQVPADFDLAAERASGGLDTRIRRITGDLGYEIVWVSAYRFHERVAERFSAGRVFLAGDAAHLYAPFGARGLNSGLQDAENLAWKLAFTRRGWSPEALLASYHPERSAAARENLRVTSATMEFLVPQTEQLWQRRRTVLEQAVTDPRARSQIDSGKLAEPFCYAGSPLTTPGLPAAGGADQPGAPVPGALCPDGPCTAAGHRTRLRRLFGSSFVVLAGPAATARAAERVAAAAVAAPVAAYPLEEIDTDAALRPALAATPDSVHVVRPDGHLAAVLGRLEPEILAAALGRAAGHHIPPDREGCDALLPTGRRPAGQTAHPLPAAPTGACTRDRTRSRQRDHPARRRHRHDHGGSPAMTAAVTRTTPPLILVKIGNPVMRRLLRSPLHRGVSNALLLLHFTGRKTGRRYDIPAGYHYVDGRFSVFTNSPWRVNLRGGADIEVTFRGRRRPMHATLDEDPRRVAAVYRGIISSLGWQKAQRRLGITIAVRRTPTLEELEEAVRQSGLSIVTLTPADARDRSPGRPSAP